MIITVPRLTESKRWPGQGEYGDEVRGSTIFVNASGGGDYTHIQWAIDNASDGDTIYVEAGSYYENITISKKLDLISTDYQNTVINYPSPYLGENVAVLINANRVKFIGFRISVKSYSRGSAIMYGILLKDANHCRIEKNNVTNVSLHEGLGIYLQYSNNNTIENNILSNNDESIYVQYSHNNHISNNTCNNNYRNGISFYYSNDNIISKNTCNSNKFEGISFSYSDLNIITNNKCDLNDGEGISSSNSANNQIINNSCSLNNYGISLYNGISHSSHANVFTKNKCRSNINYGIMLHNNTHDNIIFNNIFIDNNYGNVQAVDNGTKNKWNKDLIGNYWSDWTGPDINIDGIVDQPYVIGGSAGSKDIFPMTNPNRIPIPLANAGPDITVIQHENVIFNSSACVGHEYIVKYAWNFTYDGKEQFLYGPEQIFAFHIFGKYIVTLTVENECGQGTSDRIFVIVKDNVFPIAEAGSDIIIDQHENAYFNANESFDNVGIVNYTWSFFNGQKEIYRYGITTEYIFNKVEKYIVTLKVSDADANWDTDTLNVTVLDSTPPFAYAGPDITINQSDTVEFFFHQDSSDNIGCWNWTWTFKYDDANQMLFHSIIMSSLPFFKFDIPGNYSVTMTVYDEAENRGFDTLNVTVLDSSPLEEIDSDNDSFNDTYELEQGSDPFNPLSYPGSGPEDDETSTSDGEKDTDNDTYNDTYELEQGSDPYDPLSTPLDWDGDGVPNEDDAFPRDPKRWKQEGTSIFTIFSVVILISLVILACLMAYTRIKRKQILDNDIRHNLYAYINHNPGKHFRKIKKHMKVSQGTLTHHLRCLTNANLIKAKQQGNFKFYYPTWMRDQQKPLTPVQKEIIQIVKQQSGIEIKELAVKLDRESRTVRYHLNNLLDLGKVRSENIEKRTCWFLEEQKEDNKGNLT